MSGDFYNTTDYVRDTKKTFAEKPLNAVDAMVFCQLTYGKMEELLDSRNLSRRNAGYSVRDFWCNEYAGEMFCDGISDKENRVLFGEAAGSRRFRDLKVKNVESELNPENNEQFAAVTYEIDDNTDFVCFRGTDGTLMGWKEDFSLSFMEEVASQRAAVEYLNRYYGKGFGVRKKKIYIGGHSKGGNLSIYAAAFCKPEVRQHIVKVYSMDGPGFRDEVAEYIVQVLDEGGFDFVKIVPQSSIVGMLLQTKDDFHVVKSRGHGGISQHDPHSWNIAGDNFDFIEGMSRSGMIMDRTVHDWLQKASAEQREMFTEAIFGTLFENGVETVTDLKHIGPTGMARILSTFKGLDDETKEAVSSMLTNLAKASLEQIRK